MIDKETLLKYYGREDIQKALVATAANKEVGVRFGEKGYGKRPDMLKYPNEIFDLAKDGATSFHFSEELWKDPMRLATGMKKKDVDELRIGWDLIIDIDCPYWKLSRIITWLIIEALKEQGLKNISVKFSGNKGFHIGVPFSSFPKSVNGQKTSELFPDAPKKISFYLLDYISNTMIEVKENKYLVFRKKFKISFSQLKQLTGMDMSVICTTHCSNCNSLLKEVKPETKIQFICPSCDSIKETKESFEKCEKCKVFMEKMSHKKDLCKCGYSSYYYKFNPLSIVEIDTILISPRHLYRAPYSLHEKSGLASILIDPSKILEFEKNMAKPEKVKISKRMFLPVSDSAEAKQLVINAFDFDSKPIYEEEKEEHREFESLQEAIPLECFPPCIINLLKGLEDGRKRALFILINFLRSVGWDFEMIEKLISDWNKKNNEELRGNIIQSQISYRKRQEIILPPNCSNKMYYQDMHICKPDGLCAKSKNPVSYAKKRFFMKELDEKKVKKKVKKTVKTPKKEQK